MFRQRELTFTGHRVGLEPLLVVCGKTPGRIVTGKQKDVCGELKNLSNNDYDNNTSTLS